MPHPGAKKVPVKFAGLKLINRFLDSAIYFYVTFIYYIISRTKFLYIQIWD
jgi:hypothetical protein